MSIYQCALTAFTIAGLVRAQSGPSSPTVEVSSVVVHQGGLPRSGGTLTTSGPKLSIRGFSALGLLLYAYHVRIDQIVHAKPLDSTLYDVDVVASAERVLTTDEFRKLLQSVLAERFHLQAHRESRPTPVYALVAGKHGTLLHESAPGTKPGWEGAADGHNMGLLVRRSTLAALAERISSEAGLDRPVIDRTGLTGEYDIRLVYTSRYRMTPGDASQIDVFTAVEEQLGLKLDAVTAPLELLIIDQIDKPTAN